MRQRRYAGDRRVGGRQITERLDNYRNLRLPRAVLGFVSVDDDPAFFCAHEFLVASKREKGLPRYIVKQCIYTSPESAQALSKLVLLRQFSYLSTVSLSEQG